MKVKKYRADNMQEAILKVKSDLGPNAIILHTRKFKTGGFFGFFAKKKVEVIATVEKKSRQQDKNNQLRDELNQMKGMMDNLIGEIKSNNKANSNVIGNSALQQLVEALWGLGISHTTAQDLAQRIIGNLEGYTLDEDKVKEELKKELKKKINNINPVQLEDGKTKVISLVGPTGVGKTTTLAKLAANFALFEEKEVGLITADTYRIAAVEQLKTYSEIINLPLEVVFTPQELITAIENYQGYDLVLVDTAGRSQNNQIHISELKGFIKNAPIDEIYLVLSATTKVTDIIKLIEVYSELDLDKLIITKLDETGSLGIIFEAITKAKKPLSYVTIGQDVPEDIKLPEADDLVDDIAKGLKL